MELNTTEYKLATALRELKRRVDRGEITEEQALEIMQPLTESLSRPELAEGGEIGQAHSDD